MINDKFLLGFTENNSVIFADVHYDKDCRGTLGISFTELNIIEYSEDLVKERIELYVDDMGNDELGRFCRDWDCKPSEVADILYDNDGYSWLDIDHRIGILEYADWEYEYALEYAGCGQHDTREYINPLNEEFCNYLHKIWDNFHLKMITDEQEQELKNKIMDYKNDVASDEEEIIIKYISENIEYCSYEEDEE